MSTTHTPGHPRPARAPARATRRLLLGSALLGAGLLLSACNATPPQTPEQAVTQRAEERWAALVDGDLDLAWTYTQPGYRAVVNQRQYRGRFGAVGEWKGAQIHEVNCQAERCSVRVRLTSVVNMPKFRNHEIDGFISETWVREDGQWWYYQTF